MKKRIWKSAAWLLAVLLGWNAILRIIIHHDHVTENWQTVAALAVVGMAALLLARRAWRQRRKRGGGCGGDCGCAR